MDRKTFLKTTLASAAALAVAPSALVSCKTQEKKASTPLRISFQEGLTPGETLAEKLDFMEKLGVTGLEPGGRGLAGRVQEIREALKGQGFSGCQALLEGNPEGRGRFFLLRLAGNEGTGRNAFFGIQSFKTPSSNLALTSSVLTPSPT